MVEASEQGGRLVRAQVDEAEALRRIGGDREVLADVIAAFLDSYDDSMRDIRNALSSGGAALAFAVHRFKGALAQLAAHPALEAAVKLEEAATGRRAETLALFTVFQAEMERLIPALRLLASRLS